MSNEIKGNMGDTQFVNSKGEVISEISGTTGEVKIHTTCSSEPKVTECWMDSDKDGCPDVYEDISISSTEYFPFKKTVVLWREDYDAMRTELENLRTFVQQLGDHAAYGEFGKKRLEFAEREGEK
jgi:hypothetical protein